MMHLVVLLSLLLLGCGIEDPVAPSVCPAAKRAAGVDLPSGHYRTFEGGSAACPFDTFDIVFKKDSAHGYGLRHGDPSRGRYSFPGGGWAKYTYDVPVGGGWGRLKITGPARDGGDPPLYFEAQFEVIDSTEYRLMYGASCIFAMRKSTILPDSSEVWPPPPSTGIRPPKPTKKECQE